MSNRVFSDKLLETAVCDFLPSEVVFALGDKHKVECAARWINSLQAENKKLREALEREGYRVGYLMERLGYPRAVQCLEHADNQWEQRQKERK